MFVESDVAYHAMLCYLTASVLPKSTIKEFATRNLIPSTVKYADIH